MSTAVRDARTPAAIASVDADGAASTASTSRRSPTSSARRCSCTTRTSSARRCREYGDALRRRRSVVRGQGVPVHGDGAAGRTRRGSTSTCATGGELHVALHAGFPADAHRVPRQQQVRRRAAAPRSTPASGRIVVDSFDELDRLEALVGAVRRAARARPGHARRRGAHARVHRDRHRATRSSGSPSSERRRAATPSRRVVRSRRRCASAGFHCHIGSQIFVLDSFAQAAAVVAELARRRRRATRARAVAELNLGGGLGVPLHRRRARRPTIAELDATRANCADACTSASSIRRRRSRSSRAGRSPRAAGVTLYRVGTIKEIPGVAHLRRGRRRHERQPAPGDSTARATRRASRHGSPRPGRSSRTVVGKHCEQGDVLVARRAAARRRRGRRRAGHAGDRRVRLLDGVATTTRCRARPSCSCATGDARVVVRPRDARRSRRTRRRATVRRAR